MSMSNHLCPTVSYVTGMGERERGALPMKAVESQSVARLLSASSPAYEETRGKQDGKPRLKMKNEPEVT